MTRGLGTRGDTGSASVACSRNIAVLPSGLRSPRAEREWRRAPAPSSHEHSATRAPERTWHR
jgi:hypothetical protein